MKTYKWTIIGLICAVSLYLITILFELDLFEMFVEFLEDFEKFEIDEFLIPSFILLLFIFYDVLRKQKEIAIERKKIEVYNAVITAVHHILNNFLNNMQLFKVTAEETPEFDPDILSLYDAVIDDATVQIKALSSVTKLDETSIKTSVLPQPDAFSNSQLSSGTDSDYGQSTH